jgi:predicted phosphodiesterase
MSSGPHSEDEPAPICSPKSFYQQTLTSLVIGDPHFKVDNIEETNALSTQAVQAVIDTNPDYVVCLGDTLDGFKNVKTPALDAATKFLQKLSNMVPVYLLIGNHDRLNNSDFLTDKHPFNAFKQWANMVVVDKVITITIRNILHVFVPYVPSGRFDEALRTLPEEDRVKVYASDAIVYAHQEFRGCQMDSKISTSGDKWNPSWSWVVSGHIHDYQKLSKVLYPGAPLQHTFTKRKDRSLSLITVSRFPSSTASTDVPTSGGTVRPSFEPMEVGIDERRIMLDVPIKVIIEMTYAEFIASNIHSFFPLLKEGAAPEFSHGRLIKVHIKGTMSELKSISQIRIYSILRSVGVSFKNENISPAKLSVGVSSVNGCRKNYMDTLIELLDSEEKKMLNSIIMS